MFVFTGDRRKGLSLDIKQFYDHLTDWMVYQFFIENGYEESVAMMLTGLCWYEGMLAAGSANQCDTVKPFDDKV